MRLRQDLAVAFRGFRRSPTFVVAVVAILGLGIGMATAMFSTFQAVLVRRLPVQDQARLAVLWPYRVPTAELSPSADVVVELRRASRTMLGIADVAHWGAASNPFQDGDHIITLARTEVSANYFDVLPITGRHPETIRRAVKAGTLPDLRANPRGHHRIRRADLERLGRRSERTPYDPHADAQELLKLRSERPAYDPVADAEKLLGRRPRHR